METKDQIKDYISKITSGLISITDKQSEDIMLICSNQKNGTINFYRYSLNVSTGIPTAIFNKKIQIEEIKLIDIISKNKDKILEPETNKLYYKYECLNNNGVLLAIIYSNNNCLFN